MHRVAVRRTAGGDVRLNMASSASRAPAAATLVYLNSSKHNLRFQSLCYSFMFPISSVNPSSVPSLYKTFVMSAALLDFTAVQKAESKFTTNLAHITTASTNPLPPR